MKLFILVAMFVGSSAFAATCPNFSGTFSCLDNNGETGELIVWREMNDEGYYVFNVNDDFSIIADGQPHTLPLPGFSGSLDYHATCDQSKLSVDGTFTSSTAPQRRESAVAEMQKDDTFSLNYAEDGTLLISATCVRE